MVKRGKLEWHNDPLGKALRGAVKDAINKHGAITANHSRVNSVVKRVYGVFKAYKKGKYDNAREKALRKYQNKS